MFGSCIELQVFSPAFILQVPQSVFEFVLRILLLLLTVAVQESEHQWRDGDEAVNRPSTSVLKKKEGAR